MPTVDAGVLRARLDRTRALMAEAGAEAMLLSLGKDLPYLTGYVAMPLERLTMLVVPAAGVPTLVVPGLEAPRVVPHDDVFTIRPWAETEQPCRIVAELCGGASSIAIGDQTWARFLVELGDLLPGVTWRRATPILAPMRTVKDRAEIDALVAAGAAADRVAAQLHAGEIPLVGRTEAEVSADLSARLIAEGHDVVNFAIVASGPNAASPHHEAGSRVIEADEVVLCDFGGTMAGYCSDITRCVVTGTPSDEITAAYEVLMTAQAAGMEASTVGASCASVDRAARDVIDEAGLGEHFIHRTGHGIGMDAHEDPYIVEGNDDPVVAGNAFSVEPGIYVAGRWGLRLEDCVVATEDGPLPLNRADHSLVRV